MAKFSRVAGATSQSVNVFIQDSSSSTGAGLTGLAFGSSGLTCYYTHTGANCTATAITLATLAAVSSAWSSGGFKEIDSTHTPGLYRFDIPNAVLATSKGNLVTIYLQGAASMAPCLLEIELTGLDNQDGVRGGMTALPNVAAGASGGLPLSADASGRVDVLKINGTSQTAKDLGAINVTTLNTLSGHDPGATLGTSTLTQAQVTGGAYALNSASFAFASALDLTATQKASVTTAATAATPTVTAGTVNDKTGYSLTQSFPSNFASLGITAGGKISGVVLCDANTDMRGTDNAALATQIPANFTTSTFASAGVFSTAALANAPTGGSAPTVSQIRTEMDTNSTKLASIDAKTTNLPVSPAAVGSAMTLADGAITDAKITLPTEATGTPSTALQILMWIAGMLGWRKVIKNSNTGTIKQYMADGTTTKTTSTFTSVTDVDTLNKAT